VPVLSLDSSQTLLGALVAGSIVNGKTSAAYDALKVAPRLTRSTEMSVRNCGSGDVCGINPCSQPEASVWPECSRLTFTSQCPLTLLRASVTVS
jgi:hypothetical protein